MASSRKSNARYANRAGGRMTNTSIHSAASREREERWYHRDDDDDDDDEDARSPPPSSSTTAIVRPRHMTRGRSSIDASSPSHSLA